MTPMVSEIVLALTLITAPGIETPAPNSEKPFPPPPVSVEAIRLVSEALELSGEGERHWLFAVGQWSDPYYPLRETRERYERCRDYPPLCDAVRFPSAELCRDMLDCNRRHEAWLEERQRLMPGEEWIREALRECKECREVWWQCECAGLDYYSVTARREAMNTLRKLIGPVAYYSGCLPPPVPVWRMRRAD